MATLVRKVKPNQTVEPQLWFWPDEAVMFDMIDLQVEDFSPEVCNKLREVSTQTVVELKVQTEVAKVLKQHDMLLSPLKLDNTYEVFATSDLNLTETLSGEPL